ncbi:hypothetical protein N0V93_004856 [Gnomoniopsis smithogilvyi]|uniref:Uncharacterized protein n=1 Tax=Gnomoniopsis smithogilvyi TaxID=1191159 RepID=A0A9W8YS79_9PEZI|nr:hypothetical protein N0V93_004856 [Gnomoniopsis smithogilvyi]
MFCILGPEMGLGDPQLAGRTLRSRFSSNKLKDSTQAAHERPGLERPDMRRNLSSIFSSNYDSIKSSVKRATSVRVTKRERRITKAQDIFPRDTESVHQPKNTPIVRCLGGERPNSHATVGRATTPSTALSLDKPLPATPDERTEVQDDVLVRDFEGYLDILAYLQRGLPSRPTSQQEPGPEKGSSPTPAAQAILTPAPKEEEWMSTRPVSQTSSYKTVSASSDELRRLKSRPPSGAPTRCTSVSENTVTPKSSRESEWGMRGAKTALPGLGFASRIEEVSEPGTASPVLTPDRRTSVSQVCYHCGRDPTGKDVKDMSGTPTTVLEISKFNNLSEADLRKGRGPSITAKDAQGQRYALYPETSYYKVLEEEEDVKDKMPKTPENAIFTDFSSPLARPSNPDPYATTYSSPDELPKPRQRAEIEIENDIEIYDDAEITPTSKRISELSALERVPSPDPCAFNDTPSLQLEQVETAEAGQFGAESATDRSFWKDSEGVILVYQGVEVGGKELVYGADINYLGSFYDDDEGSSGLGSNGESSHDLVGTGSGLAVIPECASSDDLWDDGAFDAY